MEEQIQELLNSIPQGVTYTTFPEDLLPEDISQERIDGLKKLLTNEDVFIELCAAQLLCAWGIDEGFKTLIQLYEAGKAEGYFTHRLHGYDETAEQLLWPLLYYQSTKEEISKEAGEKARLQICPYVKQLLQKVHNPEQWEKWVCDANALQKTF